MSRIIIGIDEAGYGPNLGPLVVAATMWRCSDSGAENLADGVDLYEELSAAVTRESPGHKQQADLRVLIADSKQVYSKCDGIGRLERGVLASLVALGHRCDDVAALWETLAADSRSQRDALPWHDEHSETLPIAADVDDVYAAGGALSACLCERRIELLDVAACAVFPGRFNWLTDRAGSKGRVNSDAAIGLARSLIDAAGALPDCDGERHYQVVCDKHGGRNRYAALLQSHFPESWIEIGNESRQRSTYRWPHGRGAVEARFEVGAERHLPVALASMTAKYLRELAMRAFNGYWCQRVADLRPTAGYPVDARRFKKDIAAVQASLGIPDELLWRSR
ncbi:MAG: hypothetical protein KDA63_07480 [Planctomycetales bacterium]|nr:hypothetical protein [Planctomycetales bacterium]